MEGWLHRQHVKHYQLAQGSPFTVAPLSNLFGEYTETHFSEQFQNSKVNIDEIEGISQQTKLFLKELVPSPADPPPVETYFTVEQVKEGFMLQKEKPQHCHMASILDYIAPGFKLCPQKKYSLGNDSIKQ
eukprot:12576530-Ditylum_brightwellii.AAC.1